MIEHIIAFAAALQQESTSPKIFAVCGVSIGISNYLEPRITGWERDTISGGTITLLRQADGRPDVMTRDATGRTQFASQSGLVAAPLVDEQSGSYIYVVIDGERNEVTTYNVSRGADGKVTLLWTDIKNKKTAARITKVSAYQSPCEGAN